MTVKIAVTGKSGSGKTTITKAFLSIIREYYPEKSVLVLDNDLSGEFGHSFGLDIRNTIYVVYVGYYSVGELLSISVWSTNRDEGEQALNVLNTIRK